MNNMHLSRMKQPYIMRYTHMFRRYVFLILVVWATGGGTTFGQTVLYSDLVFRLNPADKTATVVSLEDFFSNNNKVYVENKDYFDEYKDEILNEYKNLTRVEIPETVPYEGDSYRVTEIGIWAFYLYNSMVTVTIPNSVDEIDEMAFMDCPWLQEVVLPDSLLYLSDHAFMHCEELVQVHFPEGLELIGYSAFFNCFNLRSVTLPASMRLIKENAFCHCYELNTVTCLAEKPPLMGCGDPKHKGGQVFGKESNQYPDTLYVPKKSVLAYKRAYQWKQFKTILPIPKK